MVCRPVDCFTKAPLVYLPGFINETIYTDNIQTGWAWYPYMQNNKQLQVRHPRFASIFLLHCRVAIIVAS